MRRTTIISLLSVLVMLFGVQASAQLRYVETERVRVVYVDPIHSFIVPHVARCLTNAMAFHEDFWDCRLDEKVTVLLYDLTDYGNASANNVPHDLVLLALAPLSYAYETMPANERVNALLNHELVHIHAMDRASTGDKFYRSLFWGKPVPTAENPLSILYTSLTAPRRSAPRWYHEGIAVFLETWMAGGYGRALGSYDEMVFRTKVAEDARFYDPVGLEAEGIAVDFHVGVNSYLYGTRFFSYLARMYGPESLQNWVSRKNGTNAYFVSQFKTVFGRSLDDEWKRWIQSEHEWQQENLAAIRTYPVTEHQDITKGALGALSRALYDPDKGKLFAAVNFPGKIAHLTSIDVNTGEADRICDVKGPALFGVSSVAYDPATNSLFYTTDNYGWRDIRVVDTETHKSRTLLKDERIGDLAFNRADQSLWGIRHFNGISTLVRIPPPYDEWHTVYAWPFGRDLYDIDVSPDGTRLTGALAEISGHQHLIVMDIPGLLAGDSSYTTLFDFGISNPEGFSFSDDGHYLYGTSYYTGVSNVFRYDFARDSMEALTNCETGYFRPIPYKPDSLIVFRFTTTGFVPSKIREGAIEDINPIRYLGQAVVQDHPVVKEWKVAAPRTVDVDSVIIARGAYNSFANLSLASIQPVVEGYKDYVTYGFRFDVSDDLYMHSGAMTVSYAPNRNLATDERWHVKWKHTYRDWTLRARYNGTDFYDLFGPTKTSRKGYSVGLEYDRNLLHDEPKKMDLHVGVTRHGDLEVLPDYQNVATRYDKFSSFSAQVRYEDLRSSMGAVAAEKGWIWQLISDNNYVRGTAYPHVAMTLDCGVPLPLHHSSIWLRSAGGYSHGDRDEPLANFYFGGFGNNWVDYRSERRYREYYAFPGTELNELGGTDFAKLSLEWNLPPLRFGRLGFPSLYASWARTVLFSQGLVTNIRSRSAEIRAASVGGQVDIRMQLLSYLKLTFSAGYASAFRRGGSRSDEFMFSLKIL